MRANWKHAAVLSAVVAVASCSGNAYQDTPGGQYQYESGGFDTNWVWAGLALALLFAVSRN
jgi:uncharacterized membrane protein YphA (DoxX/SURF4 family)